MVMRMRCNVFLFFLYSTTSHLCASGTDVSIVMDMFPMSSLSGTEVASPVARKSAPRVPATTTPVVVLCRVFILGKMYMMSRKNTLDPLIADCSIDSGGTLLHMGVA